MARHKKSGERLNLIWRKVQLGATKQDQEFLQPSAARYRAALWPKPLSSAVSMQIARSISKTLVLKNRTPSDDRRNLNKPKVAPRRLSTPQMSKAHSTGTCAVADGVHVSISATD
jgi:hypothetical protein